MKGNDTNSKITHEQSHLNPIGTTSLLVGQAFDQLVPRRVRLANLEVVRIYPTENQ